MPDLFDMQLRAQRRDRAARTGAELFLYERVFEDCLARIGLLGRHFRSALLIGCPDPGWPNRLCATVEQVDVRDPGPLFAAAAGGSQIVEDAWDPAAERYDLVLAIGTLDTVNDFPLALRLVRHSMQPDSLFIGAFSGGETLPALRTAMRAADAVSAGATPHVHPRIEPFALAPLLGDAGFIRPVVDVDRVRASYSSLRRLAADLRAMGATNVLRTRGRPLVRRQFDAGSSAFANGSERTTETFEILHFAAWTPDNK